MARVYVHTPFTVTVDKSKRLSFDIGDQEIDDDLATHWYVKHHLGKRPVAKASAQRDEGAANAEHQARAAALVERESALNERDAALSAAEGLLSERERRVAALEADLAARIEAQATAAQQTAQGVPKDATGADAAAAQKKQPK